jgi:copper homeostasis protein
MPGTCGPSDVALALEVIASSVYDAEAAAAGGASRIELVTDLGRGGLTPPLALIEDVLAWVNVPVRVMVRASEAHVVSDPAVRARLVADAAAVASCRPHGVVFGAIHQDAIDEALLAAVAEAAKGLPITFHRAFEALPDWHAGVRALRRHSRVDRLLIDGGPGNWHERAQRLAALAHEAGPDLIVLAGGGITEAALDVLAATPGLTEVHVGRLVRDPPTADGVVSAVRVAAIVARLSAASG